MDIDFELSKEKDEYIASFKKDFQDKLNSTIKIYLDEATKYCNLKKEHAFPLSLISKELYEEYSDAINRYEDKTEFFIKLLSYGLISDSLKNLYLEIEEIYYEYLKIVSEKIKKEFENKIKRLNNPQHK